MQFISSIAGGLWSFPMPALIAFTGLWLGVRGGAFRALKPKTVIRDGLSRLDQGSFSALSTALAGTVGTGNVVGVAVAIYFGGPGALFWMWISALIGIAVKYSEALLAVKYRGGPMYYISRGLGHRGLATAFAAAASVAALCAGNMAQVGAISASASDIFGGGRTTQMICAASVALLVLIAFRGSSRGKTLNFIVPFMAAFYLFGCAAVIIKNLSALPGVFTAILKGAPRPEAMAWGFRRGIVSNEAGVGSSPIAHAENRGKTPREEGALGVIEVAFDTLLISTFSGLMLLTSGTEELPALWPSRALSSALGGSAPAFTAVSIALFAFSSVLSWSIYGEKSFAYLTGGRGIALYRAAFVFTAAASAMMSFDSAVAVSDLMNAVMALPNLAGLLMLAPSVRKETFSR